MAAARLLGMPLHSERERAAFAPGALANPRRVRLFVDLDGDARQWNAARRVCRHPG